MRLNEGQRKKSIISLTPLIDVVFLLLIFFMLASTFLKFSALPISGAQGGGTSQNLNEIIFIHVRGPDALQVNGKPIEVGQMMTRLDELIAKGMSKAVIHPGKEASVQDLVKVLETARKSNLKSVVVVR